MARVKEYDDNAVWVDAAVRGAAIAFQVDPEDILGPRRYKAVAQARQAAAVLLRDICGMSYPKIAAALGRKDHTTIVHAVQIARVKTRQDSEFARKLLAAQGFAESVYVMEYAAAIEYRAWKRKALALEAVCMELVDMFEGNRPFDSAVVERACEVVEMPPNVPANVYDNRTKYVETFDDEANPGPDPDPDDESEFVTSVRPVV